MRNGKETDAKERKSERAEFSERQLFRSPCREAYMLFNLSDYFYIWANKRNGETLQPAVKPFEMPGPGRFSPGIN